MTPFERITAEAKSERPPKTLRITREEVWSVAEDLLRTRTHERRPLMSWVHRLDTGRVAVKGVRVKVVGR